MASSRIEIASSPYACILRDHNQRIRDREKKREGTEGVIRKNLEEFVRDHLHTCIALPTPIDSDIVSSNESSRPRFTNRGFRKRNKNYSSNHNFRPEWVEREKDNDDNQEAEIVPGESLTVSTMRRQSRIRDRWSDRQAGEPINTVEKQTNEADVLALSSSPSVWARASSFLSDNSPTASESSIELPNLRASSLVQMWKDIEAESTIPSPNKSGKAILNPNMSRSSSTGSNRNISPVNNIEDSSYVEDPFMRSEVCESSVPTYEPITVNEDSNDEMYEAITVPQDSSSDWESDRTAPSGPHLSFQRQSSDVGESDRGRVADIIRKLTSASQPSSPVAHPRDETSREHSVEPLSRNHTTINLGITPRVRGRHAVKDLLVQSEQERKKELSGLVERHAVSRFSQRGRLQSLLRLKVLQREAAAKDQQLLASTTSELDKLPCRPTILHLRERFNSKAEQNSTKVYNREDSLRSPAPLRINTRDSKESVKLGQEGSNQAGVSTTSTFEWSDPQSHEHHSIRSTSEQLQEEERQSSDLTLEGPRTGEVGQLDRNQRADTPERSSHGLQGVHIITEEPEIEIPSHVESIDCWGGPSSEIVHLDWELQDESAESSNGSREDGIIEEPGTEIQTLVGPIGGGERVTLTEEQGTQQLVESDNTTWLGNTPRSVSDFEGRRQAWYSDMLDNNSDNYEVRELFERRSVSTFLTSSLRDRMDRMLCGFVGRQNHLVTSIPEEEEEEETTVSNQYNEVSDDSVSLQLPIPSRLRSPSAYQDNNASDGYDQFASTSFQQPQSSRSYGGESQQSSPCTRRNSLEMELIYDLRGYMAQLSQEMSELRKSIHSCMGMQDKLQNSIKKEPSAALSHSREDTESSQRQPTRRINCCICCEMQVDSLLYRCGHMCTCFKCAHELQWSSGRCPICRSPILDVVRAYPDT